MTDHTTEWSANSAEACSPPRLTEMLAEVSDRTHGDRVSVRTLVEAFRYRASGALLFLFAVPNVLPMPPGTSGILGLPLVIIAFQLMGGRPLILPDFVLERSISGESFARMVDQTVPRLKRIERLLRPRMPGLTGDAAERVIGAFCLALAVILTLPIPLGNVLPALAISIIALGMIERDGVWVLAGFAVGVAAMIVVGGVLWAMARAALFFFASIAG
jgi:hypothetical protein